MTFLIKHNNNLFNDKLLTFPNLTIGGHDKPTTKLEESSPGTVTMNTIPLELTFKSSQILIKYLLEVFTYLELFQG